MYKNLRFCNTLYLLEALNTEAGENPNHCAGNRLDGGLWSREVVNPHFARCMPDQDVSTRRHVYVHAKSAIVGVQWT